MAQKKEVDKNDPDFLYVKHPKIGNFNYLK